MRRVPPYPTGLRPSWMKDAAAMGDMMAKATRSPVSGA
jgi:hypothetical protein